MARCQECGRDFRTLHKSGEKSVCWLCLSISGGENAEDEDDRLLEKRHFRRFEVSFAVEVSDAEGGLAEVSGVAINLSPGGTCFKWSGCEECQVGDSGFLLTSKCIFGPYRTGGDKNLTVMLHLDDDEPMVVQARVANVFKVNEDEYVGLQFVAMAEDVDEKIRAYLLASHA